MARLRRTRPKPLRIPQRQWTLPAGMHAASGLPASLKDLVDPDVPTVSFEEMSRRRQADLVAARIQGQRRFQLWVLGGPTARITKRGAIEAVRARTPLGEALIDVEQNLIAMVADEATRRQSVRRRRAK